MSNQENNRATTANAPKRKRTPPKGRPLWAKKLAYRFDNYMTKGPIAQFAMLFIVMAVIVIFFGELGALTDITVTTGSGVWQSLMHLIDSGTITGDSTINREYLFLMGIVTVCGMIFTGMMISIISNALDRKMSKLQKGHSQIVEKNHSVVIGFDENIYCILEELIEANKNQKGCCIVVLAEEDKEVMEQKIHEHLKNIYKKRKFTDRFKREPNEKIEHKTKLICRSGKTVQAGLFEMASLEDAKSVIINDDDDFMVIRILLAVTNYLREHHKEGGEQPTITTLLHEQRSIEAAKIAGEGFRVTNIYFESMLGRIMAQVCRQPGLSNVLLELFDYKNSEFYLEPVKNHEEMIGRTFAEIINSFPNSAIVGMKRQGEICLNPAAEVTVCEDDSIIHIAEDDDKITGINLGDTIDVEGFSADGQCIGPAQIHMVVFGFNVALPNVLRNLDGFVAEGSSVLIVADKDYSVDALNKSLKNFAGHVNFRLVQGKTDRTDVASEECEDIYSQTKIRKILEEREKTLGCKLTNILLLCEDNIAPERADAQATVQLLNLRKIISDLKMDVILTSEMNLVDDQILLNEQNEERYARVSDFVVGSDLANKIVAQVSNEPALHQLYKQLLEAYGSEIYLRPIRQYVNKKGLESQLSFRQLTRLAYQKKHNYDMVIGWKRKDDFPEINPAEKDKPRKFKAEDQLIVIAKH